MKGCWGKECMYVVHSEFKMALDVCNIKGLSMESNKISNPILIEDIVLYFPEWKKTNS